MKRTLILLLCLASSSALADCYQRSNIKITQQKINTAPTDIQTLVTPDARGQRCVARYRLHIGNAWATVEGTAVAKTEEEACGQAMDLKRGVALEEVAPATVSADHQMVCSDLPDIRVRPVRKGELIWESETDLHSNILERRNPYFQLKEATCRKFIERTPKHQNLIIYQGIICKATTSKNSKWVVLDKY